MRGIQPNALEHQDEVVGGDLLGARAVVRGLDLDVVKTAEVVNPTYTYGANAKAPFYFIKLPKIKVGF